MSDQESVPDTGTGEEQGSDEGAVDQTEPTIEFNASYGEEAEAPDVAVDSTTDESGPEYETGRES